MSLRVVVVVVVAHARTTVQYGNVNSEFICTLVNLDPLQERAAECDDELQDLPSEEHRKAQTDGPAQRRLRSRDEPRWRGHEEDAENETLDIVVRRVAGPDVKKGCLEEDRALVRKLCARVERSELASA